MIYLDHSATTPPDEDVLQSFVEVSRNYFGNPASIHQKGREAEILLEKARTQILKLLQIDQGEVIFTSGGTEANNLAILGYADALQEKGNHIITTEIEHPSILKACERLENKGFNIHYLKVDDQGHINVDELEQTIRKDTILVSIMHVNNEIGTLQPIEQCGKIIRQRSNAIFHVDCVQSYGKVPIDFSKNGPDAMTFSSHKINGLKYSGALVIRHRLLPNPILLGGGQEKKLRSGTVSVAHAVALAKAMRLIKVDHMDQHIRPLKQKIIRSCRQYEKIRVLTPERSAPHICAIAFEGIRGEVAVNFFQAHHIIVSTSSACSSKKREESHVIRAIRLEEPYKAGVIRVSLGKETTEREIDQFLQVLHQFMELLERGKKK